MNLLGLARLCSGLKFMLDSTSVIEQRCPDSSRFRRLPMLRPLYPTARHASEHSTSRRHQERTTNSHGRTQPFDAETAGPAELALALNLLQYWGEQCIFSFRKGAAESPLAIDRHTSHTNVIGTDQTARLHERWPPYSVSVGRRGAPRREQRMDHPLTVTRTQDFVKPNGAYVLLILEGCSVGGVMVLG